MISNQFTQNPNPLLVTPDDRVCLIFHNFNSMGHVLHLHGHSFQVTSIDGKAVAGAMRDTVLISRGNCREMTICFDADHPGTWPLHSAMEYYLAAGMLTTVEYTF